MDPVNKVLELSGYEKLNPAQELAVKMGLVGDKNLVVAAPTASGKTLMAEIAALDTIQKGGKVIYIVPLKALASEKYEDFKKKYEPLGTMVGMSIGDSDSSDTWLAKYDLIIVTSEKLDSLLRHGISWLDQVKLVVVDEVHLLNDPSRGPTLEMVLTRLRKFINPRILALSATINNYKELADWLDAETVKSDYRPVQLYRGISFEKKITFIPQRVVEITAKNDLEFIVEDTLKKKKQVLFFVSTRRSTEALAENLGKFLQPKIKPDELEKLSEIANKVLKAVESHTKQCDRLARCIVTGTAFHHAGLVSKQRKLIEEAFKTGLIKVLTATPTLAAGINLPAYRVVIRDLKRFNSIRGTDYLPNLEVEQMGGRAGRPAYDTEGEAIIIAKNMADAQYAWENYINGEPEKIYSKLGVEPVLRTHVLALIASGTTPSKPALFDFFSKTFYAHQYQDLTQLNFNLEKVLTMLEKFKFIEMTNSVSDTMPNSEFKPASLIDDDIKLNATKIGRRVSELYIDPITANNITSSLTKMTPTHIAILQTICDCLEMKPLLNMRKGDAEEINEFLIEHQDDFVKKPPNEWEIEYDEYFRLAKTVSMFKSWTEEDGENKLLDKFNIAPGELRVRLENADWLLYSTQELALLMGLMDTIKYIRKTRLRVKHGIREELLPLIKIKGIGRKRARKLYGSQIKSVLDLRKVPLETLSRLVGPKTASEIKRQV
ncbi:MAG: DEAD/DEAH box helicase [Candidatus Aenigmatarchaeota archaeon]